MESGLIGKYVMVRFLNWTDVNTRNDIVVKCKVVDKAIIDGDLKLFVVSDSNIETKKTDFQKVLKHFRVVGNSEYKTEWILLDDINKKAGRIIKISYNDVESIEE